MVGGTRICEFALRMGNEVGIALVHLSRPFGGMGEEKTGNLTGGSIAIICPASHEARPCQLRQDSPNSHPKVAAKIGNSVSIAAKRSIKGSRRVLSEFEPAVGCLLELRSFTGQAVSRIPSAMAAWRM